MIEGKVVSIDEDYIHNPIVVVQCKDGEMRSFSLNDVTTKNAKDTLLGKKVRVDTSIGWHWISKFTVLGEEAK